jgi:hypothetical protein
VLSILASGFRSLLKNPFPLLLLQVPEWVLEFPLHWLQTAKVSGEFWIALLLFPVTWVCAAFSTAATFSYLASPEEKQPLRESVRMVIRGLKPLVLASLVTAVATTLGILLILPGFYFLTLYCFVPFLAVQRPENGVFQTLSESTEMVKKDFWRLFFFTTSIALIAFSMEYVQDGVVEGLGIARMGAQWLSATVTVLTKMFLSLSFTGFANCVLVAWYKELSQKQTV